MSAMGECAEIRPELGVYILGGISPAGRARVVQHLSSCQRCRDKVAGLAAVPGLLSKVPAETVAQLARDSAPLADPPPADALQDRLISRVARQRRRYRWLTAASVAVLAAAAGAGWASRLGPPGPEYPGPGHPGPGHPVSRAVLRTARIGGATVLTDSRGFTVYWFAPDTPDISRCTGRCARNWPPVTGPATAGPGVTGHLGTIARPGGSIQATYDGHPLYTASVDIRPGMAKGNDLDASGGIWHEVLLSGSAPVGPSPAGRTRSSYGY
jgi:predicted lipoprotein with Yx(FWY)xxD motif